MLTNEQVIKVILLLERMNAGAVAEFFFNQSSTYGAFAKDAHNSNEMNVKPGRN
jgi:hypothetical protein